jgi:hypothetical protein
MEGWQADWGRDFTLAGLIDYFKFQPMNFAPGQRWEYCNSGYILLGAIIEKATGQSYEEFLQKNIFDKLGMRQTFAYYGNRVIHRRAYGYNKGPEGYNAATYLSMTQPHAAGVLSSTVDDLARWDAALYTDQLVAPETLQRAFTSYSLPDGKLTHYGYGWAVHAYEGHTWIEHGGGIHGFLCQVARIPDERLFVAVLSNLIGADQSPDQLAFRSLACAMGKPYQDPKVISIPAEKLADFEGVYQNPSGEELVVRFEEGKLIFLPGEESPGFELQPVSENEFVSVKMGLGRLRFISDENRKATGFEHENAFKEIDDTAHKTEKPVPTPAKAAG